MAQFRRPRVWFAVFVACACAAGLVALPVAAENPPSKNSSTTSRNTNAKPSTAKPTPAKLDASKSDDSKENDSKDDSATDNASKDDATKTDAAKDAAAANDAGDAGASTPPDVKGEQVTPVDDDTKYDLKYKLAPGTVLRYDVQHHAAIRSTIDDSTQEALTKTESSKLWKVTDVLPNGQIEFMNVVERVHMVNQLPDRAATEYDSTKDKEAPPGYEDAAKAVGVPLSVVRITPRGKVVSRKVKVQQPAANPDDDAQIVVRLPDDPVKVNDSWDEPFDITVNVEGGTKSIQTRRHYKLVGVADGIASIEVTYQVLSPIDATIESQLVQRLMKGTVQFDIEKGRVAGQKFDVDKRVLGFAGPTSSMHYVMQMEEKLSDTPPPSTARKPSTARRSSSRSANQSFGKPTYNR